MRLSKKTTTASESVTITYAHGEADFSDLVQVVRCKDCENYQTEWEPSVPNRHFCAVMDSMMKPMDYCSYGERKDE